MDVLTKRESESPVLISNYEVMELLHDKIKLRTEWEEKQLANKNSNALRRKLKNNEKFRHRDWIEEQVYTYIQTTPCIGLQSIPSMNELKSKLVAYKKKKKKKKNTNNTKKQSTTTVVKEETPTPAPTGGTTTEGQQEETKMIDDATTTTTTTGFGLTEAEAIQLLNFMPKEPVEIHLMIEELHGRLSEDQQEELLALIRSYDKTTTKEEEEDGTTTMKKGDDDDKNNTGLGNDNNEDDDMEVVEEDAEEELQQQQQQQQRVAVKEEI